MWYWSKFTKMQCYLFKRVCGAKNSAHWVLQPLSHVVRFFPGKGEVLYDYYQDKDRVKRNPKKRSKLELWIKREGWFLWLFKKVQKRSKLPVQSWTCHCCRCWCFLYCGWLSWWHSWMNIFLTDFLVQKSLYLKGEKLTIRKGWHVMGSQADLESNTN